MTKSISEVSISSDYKNEISRAFSDINLVDGNERLSITLIASPAPGFRQYDLIELAINNTAVHKVVKLDGSVIDIGRLGKIEKAMLLIDHAEGINHLTNANKKLAGAVSNVWQTKFFAKHIDELSKNVPLSSIESVKRAIERTEGRIKSYHSTSFKVENVGNYNAIYNEIVDFRDKLVVLSGHMGSGKTEIQRRAYNEARKSGMFPIMLTGRRSIASNFFPVDHADHYQTSSKGKRKGLVGVINTLARSEYAEARRSALVVIIDEIEDLIDHIASGKLGHSYKDRIAALNALAEMLRNAKKVIVADATITDATVEKLAEMCNSKARIISAGEQSKISLTIQKESENFCGIIDDAKAGNKVAVFNDSNVTDFSATVEALKEASGKRVIGLNAAYFEETGRTLADIETIIEEADIFVISPVINAGASIVDERFQRVYVMSGFTLGPTSILQSLRRFRCAKEVCLSFKKGSPNMTSRSTEPRTIIHSELLKTSDYPFQEAGELFETASGKFLPSHTARKNEQFRNFRQNVIVAAQQMGFEIVRPATDQSKVNFGRKAKKAGRASNEEIRKAAVWETSALRKAGKVKEVNLGKKDAQTFAQQEAERTINALDLLQLPEITEESYRDIFKLNVDQVCLTRKIISKRISVYPSLTRMDIASDVAVKFLSEAGINFDSLRDSVITTELAESAWENLLNPVALENGNPSTGMNLIRLVFPTLNLNKKSRVQIVRDALNSLALDLTNTSKSNKARVC